MGLSPFLVMQAYAVEYGDLIGGTSQLFGTPGAIVLVSQTDASQTFLGDPTTYGSLAGLAFDSSGRLWGANNIDVSPINPITELIQIDPDTATQIGAPIPLMYNGGSATVQDLTVQPCTDVLFATSHLKSIVSTLPINHLVTIDRSTGAVTLVGPLPRNMSHSIGFDPSTGVLYDMGFDGKLYNIDPADASVISMMGTTEFLFASGLGVDASGTIWVSNVFSSTFQPIWTVDPATGEATHIGDGLPDLLADLAFVRGSQDSDCDGVHDPDDLCPNTVIPEGVPTTGELNPNHWALTKIGNGFDFDTVIKGQGKGPNRSYTIEDTAGCSCEQITEMQGLGDGHMKHGCSIGAMDD